MLTYPIVALAALLVLHSYASSGLVQLATEASYFSGLLQAFMGGYGNTIFALVALICSVLGIIRNVLFVKGGLGGLLSGKLVGLVNSLFTLTAVFGNGVIAYLKLSEEDGVYTNLLGTSFFEIVICAGLILAFFLKPKKAPVH